MFQTLADSDNHKFNKKLKILKRPFKDEKQKDENERIVQDALADSDKDHEFNIDLKILKRPFKDDKIRKDRKRIVPETHKL